jgi:histidinol dehydrogenase
MLSINLYPSKKELQKLLLRPVMDSDSQEAKVANILREVKSSGDEALKRFSVMFDKVTVDKLAVTKEEIQQAASQISDDLKNAIDLAKTNIEKFHKAQLLPEVRVETMPGVSCWRKSVAIDKVGFYIPGGTAPLFSTIIMLAVPAKIAGCENIIFCTPPDKKGNIHPAILYTASLVGITQIYKTGGAQAIAAMAYGTESIPKVYKIFGPGNQFVTSAKQLVQKDGIAIDMPAGPSEVMVIADETAEPTFIAADLLSQAEHGNDSQVLLVTTSETLAKAVQTEVDLQLQNLPRKETAQVALTSSKIIVVKEMKECIEIANEYAPEHLIISCRNDEDITDKIKNAGSVFLGNYSPESVGDYASGTNHTLPTNGYAKAYSGVSVDSFVKKITYQKLTKEGLSSIANAVQVMANAEGLQAHANAVAIRFSKNQCV